MLNKQGEGKISWCDYTWNPIQANCQFKCIYCYQEKINQRFHREIKDELREDYFKDLLSSKLKKGDRIFVGSSTDMFGDWIPSDWIQKVLDVIKLYPDYQFLFLEKNPARYYNFDFPDNSLRGCSIDTNTRAKEFIVYEPEIEFISFEPLLEKPEKEMLDFAGSMKWIIIGANSNPGALKPPDEWANMLIKEARKNNVPVHVKDNYKYKTVIKEFPE